MKVFIFSILHVFRKVLTYDDSKSYKKQGFSLSLEDTFSEKPKWEVKLTPLPPNPFKG